MSIAIQFRGGGRPTPPREDRPPPVAAGVDAQVGLGGLLFLVSGMLIGLDLADLDFAGRGAVGMVTYLAAQYLLVTRWARHVRRDAPVPV